MSNPIKIADEVRHNEYGVGEVQDLKCGNELRFSAAKYKVYFYDLGKALWVSKNKINRY